MHTHAYSMYVCVYLAYMTRHRHKCAYSMHGLSIRNRGLERLLQGPVWKVRSQLDFSSTEPLYPSTIRLLSSNCADVRGHGARARFSRRSLHGVPGRLNCQNGMPLLRRSTPVCMPLTRRPRAWACSAIEPLNSGGRLCGGRSVRHHMSRLCRRSAGGLNCAAMAVSSIPAH